ncbi:MAG: lysophospholipid acyltransferase family protein [Chthoniobacterales bacterium]
MQNSSGNPVVYFLTRHLLRGIFGSICTTKVSGRHFLPDQGPVILASNHISHFDPPALSAILSRSIDWMAMEELFENATIGGYLKMLGSIPINRHEGDTNSLRTAVKRLKAGHCIGIFPEGGLRAGETSVLEGAPFRQGTAALSAISKAPIVPCVFLGTDRLYAARNWLRPRGTSLFVGLGEPILSSDREEIQLRLAAEFIAIKNQLISEFSLAPEDLPHTPQHRKGHDR